MGPFVFTYTFIGIGRLFDDPKTQYSEALFKIWICFISRMGWGGWGGRGIKSVLQFSLYFVSK